ncbi:MAG: hypothetical protein EAZ09_18660 [Oscillatoriales cyanobacterium]|nr:MAG: hypothetical protein EAZ18_17250 [Oscillatoriales cyanobacterium]TAH18195.1 MAG: hypothetical protein EAZ09_18660 [Oscillatoriales cyanobacterium]
MNFLVEQASCLFTKDEFSCGTGKMPVPQKMNFLVEQARCLFTKDEFSCGTGILPVHKRLIENDARSQI